MSRTTKANRPLACRSLAPLQAQGTVALTKPQMAAALQISVRSLTGMMDRGEISFWRIGRLVRFRMDDAVKRMNETLLASAARENRK